MSGYNVLTGGHTQTHAWIVFTFTIMVVRMKDISKRTLTIVTTF